MNQLQKYTWLIDVIRRAGKISYKDLSDCWERNKDLSDCQPLNRATFNRWREAISAQFGIIIECQKIGGYLYYIANPEDIDDDKLKKWMLDSYAVGNIIGENLSQKCRILVDEIPSGRVHLTPLLLAMKVNHVVNISYKAFNKTQWHTFALEPYCVKLFENRWYVLGRNDRGEVKIYGLDRIDSVEQTEDTFKLPKDFDAADLFSTAFGIVLDKNVSPRRIVIRAYYDHRHYLKSLPMHHSQKLIAECDDYADFELYVAPTYDLIMKLQQYGPLVEVVSPDSLRLEMKNRIATMYNYYTEK